MNEQEMSGNEQENIAGQAMESLGMPEEVANEAAVLDGQAGGEDVTSSIQKRLGKQAERHRKEMRMMQEQMSQLQNQMGQSQGMQQQPEQHQSPTGQPQGGVDDQISRAVAAALRAKDDHEAQQNQQRSERERQEHMQKQYQDMEQDFDKASEKYEDFDDVVRHPDKPFTSSMRDYALTLPNRADVLYKLGKNPDELARVSKLKPIDQAREMFKLSVALMGGTNAPEAAPRPMGQIKGSPAASHAVSEKTSVGDIRSRMKNGNWK